MNPLGVSSHLFRGSPAGVAEALRRLGLACVQLTPGFPGLPFHEPGQITPERCRQAAEPFRAAGVAVACLFCPSPLLDPDLERRHRGLVRWHALIRHCRSFGTDRVVLETGSLSPRSPWAPFPPNRSPEAWAELRCILREALPLAADHGVILLLKPEPTHVLASVEDALRLREEWPHPCLQFVLDPAGFLGADPAPDLVVGLEQLFARLGAWAPLVHLKDVRFRADLDLARFVPLLRCYQPGAPVILEHLRPEEVGAAKAHVERFLGG